MGTNQKNKLLSIKLLILVFIAILNNRQLLTLAQESQPEPIYKDAIVANVSWSVKSQFLMFDNTIGSSWTKYDVNTQTLTQSATSPLKLTLSAGDQQLLNPAVNTVQTSMLASLDGRYVVYAGPQVRGTDAGWLLAIGDLQNRKVAVTSLEIVHPFSATDDFSVFWNAVGTTFTVKATTLVSGSALFDYVSGYQPDVSVVQTQSIDSLQIGSQTYFVDTVYAISSLGDKTLVHARLDQPSPSHLGRVLSNVTADKIIGESFVNGDPSQVLAVNETGLILDDLTTNKITILDTSINSTIARLAVFSPDSKWVAVIIPKEDSGDNVYVFNVAAKLLQTQTGVCVTDQGLLTSLNAKIDPQQWQAFINEVEAQSGKKIDQQCADLTFLKK